MRPRRELPVILQRRMSWQAALEYWAEQAGCAELNFDKSSQFARVWTYSVVYALVMTIGITVPFRWCSREKAAIKIHAEPDDDPEEGIDPATPHTVKTNKTTNTYKTYNVEASDPTPNLEEARKHLVHSSATQNHKWMSPLCTPTYRLSEVGGTGTELYFRTLRNMAFIFAYMAGITGPLVAFCWLGNFGPDTGQFLLKTTIGNLGEYADADIIDPIKRVVRLGCEGMPLKDLTGIFGWLDFSAVLVFLVYLIWARFWQIPRMAEADDMEQVTPKDYAVVIESLPAQIPDQAQYEQKLTEHLLERLRYTRGRRPSPWALPEPTVEEMVLVRDYKGRLHELTERAKLEISVGIAKAYAKGKESKKVDKLQKQLEKLEEKLGAKLDGEELLPVVRAYVILNNTEDVQNLLFDYRFAKYKLFRCCQFRARRFEGTAIRVTRAPQPTDIIWENQDIGFFNRLFRQIFVFFVFFVILSVSIAFIYLTTVASKATSKTQVSYLGVPACDPVSEDQFDINGNEPYQCMIQNAMNWTMDYAVGEGGDILSCWCTALGYQAILSNGDYMTACGPWFIELGTTIGIATGSSVIVTVINLVLQLIIQYLAEFERPLSHTALNSSMIQKAFWAQTLNTGFVLFVVNYFAPKALREAVLALPGVGFLLFRGPFAELTRGWYALVGVTLVTNMVINMFVPASVTIAKLFVTSLKRWCCRGRVAHQAELIELYTNPEFDIKVKYAQLLTTIFVTLIYGSGLPLLYFLASIFMFLQFWADKYNLLWGARRPPAYDTKMAKEAIDSMFYALPLHCVLAILMFGQVCVFPSNPLGGDLGNFANQGASYDPGLSQLFDMLSKESTWMFVLMLVVLIVLWVLCLLAWIIGGSASTAQDFLVSLCCPRWRKSQPSMEEMQAALKKGDRSISGHTIDVASTMNWDKAFHHIESTFPPASYRFERHPQLKSIAHLLRPTSPSRPNTERSACEGPAAGSDLRPEAEATPSPLSAPVPEGVARNFLQALQAEYVQGTENAVGDFFSSKSENHEHEETLSRFEEQVRAAEHKEKAISELKSSWGLD